MRRHIISKVITSLLFIIGLFAFAVINFIHTYPYLKEVSLDKITDLDSLQQVVVQTEDVIDENVYNKYTFIEAHGIWNLLLNKKEIDGFTRIKDEQGLLHCADFWNDYGNVAEDLVDEVMQLQQRVQESGGEVIVLMPPAKDDASQVEYAKGIPYTDKNWVADEYLAKLEENGIHTLDFRETLKASEMTYEEKFYATFLCYQEFVKKMDEWYNLDLDPEGLYTDSQNYNILKYEDSNLGSHGRDTGIAYAGGLDDFIVMYPKYKTSFHYEWDGQVVDGRFEDTVLCVYNLINDHIYTQDKYSTYLNGVSTCDKIQNLDNPDAPKILFLRDSYTSPLGAFVSQVFSETDLVWTYKLNYDIDKYVDIEDYDYIVVSLYPDSLTKDMFRFNFPKDE